MTIIICVMSAAGIRRNLSTELKIIEKRNINQFIRDKLKLVRSSENREGKKENLKILFLSLPRAANHQSSELGERFLGDNTDMENSFLHKEEKFQNFEFARKPKKARETALTEATNGRWQAGWLRTT